MLIMKTELGLDLKLNVESSPPQYKCMDYGTATKTKRRWLFLKNSTLAPFIGIAVPWTFCSCSLSPHSSAFSFSLPGMVEMLNGHLYDGAEFS